MHGYVEGLNIVWTSYGEYQIMVLTLNTDLTSRVSVNFSVVHIYSLVEYAQDFIFYHLLVLKQAIYLPISIKTKLLYVSKTAL